MRFLIVECSVILCVSLLASATFAYNKAHYSKLKKSKICPGCDLQVANFENLNLNAADMQKAICTAAMFDGANLLGANFGGAILIASSFRQAYLEEANFKSAKLQDADLSGTHLVNANFKQANLRGTKMEGAIIVGADFEGAIWFDGRICQSGSIGVCNK